MKVLPAGDRALLVEVADLETAHRLHATVRAAELDGLVDAVPGARTVLLVIDPGRLDPQRLAADLPGWRLTEHAGTAAATLDVPVVYDGEDLPEVARLTGLPVSEVIERHTRANHVVAFLGFTPGFGYISGSDPTIHVSRIESPRTAVPPGAVALAGPYSGIYPRSTPGGWRLIGRTDLATWDPEREQPALLQPGRRVRFVRAGAP